MITSILEEIICSEFEKNVGRFQAKNIDQHVMDIKIALNIFYDHGEDGYRNLNLRIYAPYNYVAVLVKEDWTIILENDIDYDKDRLKRGKKYIEGDTGWLIASYHDSCWRSAVQDVIRAYESRLSVIKDSYWYIKRDLGIAERLVTEELIRDHNNEKHWNVNKIAQSPFPKRTE
jgi:hypothetical protein